MIQTLKDNPKLLTFGLLASFFTGPGQTYLISFFLPGMQNDLSLSSANVGDLYFFATLAGSLLLPLVGKLLDRSDLGRLSLLMAFCLAIGCIVMSQANHFLVLLFGFFLIRCFGQGALSVITSTAISRSFSHNRGKALSLVSQGYPLAEVILPIVISSWLLHWSWRSGWLLLSAMILFVFMPATFFLLKGFTESEKTQSKKVKTSSWKIKSILMDPRFYLAITSSLVVPGALTGLFFYQIRIAELKSWDVNVMAMAFVFFGIFRSAMGFGVGFLVDRFTGRALLGIVGIPFLLGLVTLRFGDIEFAAYGFLALAGVSVGAGGNARTAFWAEAYGVENLGALRGIIAFMMVVSTAITPPIFGRLFDAKVPLDQILNVVIGFAFIGVVAGFLSSVFYRKPKEKSL